MSVRIHLNSSRPDASGWRTQFGRAKWTLRCDPRTFVTHATAGRTPFKKWDDPMEALRWMSQSFLDDSGRWIGHLSYDLGRLFEKLPAIAGDDLNLPLFSFSYWVPAEGPYLIPEPPYQTSELPFTSTFTRDGYEAAVRRTKQYIAAGDVFQVNLSQRFTAGLREQPADLYRRLAKQWPAHYGAYLNFGDY